MTFPLQLLIPRMIFKEVQLPTFQIIWIQRHSFVPDYLMESEAEKFLRSEKNIPWAVALGLVITWAIFITALFVYVRNVFVFIWWILRILFFKRAGAHTDSLVGVKCGSVWFYLTLGAAFFFLTAVTLLQAYRLSLIQKHKAEINYPFAVHIPLLWPLCHDLHRTQTYRKAMWDGKDTNPMYFLSFASPQDGQLDFLG